MKKISILLALWAIAVMFPVVAQEKATGLSDVKLYLDPGHSGTKENVGIYGYSEPEKTVRVALAIKEYLLAYTDMQEENILLCRTNDEQEVGLEARTDEANAWGADFYYSIHSDASGMGSSVNTTLYLYGGRRLAAGDYPIEKLPEGGMEFGEILDPNLTGVLRVTSRGNRNDLINYNDPGLVPYLSVNRRSNMASHLSEAGFHTNPEQNTCFMNDGFRRMQAYASYQALVRFLSKKYGTAPVQPVQVGMATGFIRDNESNLPINGATITLTKDGEELRTYTTDTYESLFNKYSTNPNELRNGFYWIEALTPGATYNVTVEADGFVTNETTVAIPATVGATTKDGLGIKDIYMSNLVPPTVAHDITNLTQTPLNRPITLTFSRKMDRASVESAISTSPEALLSFNWNDDYTLRVDIMRLAFLTEYQLKIDGNIAKNSATGQKLDGGNGEGSDFVVSFTTQPETPPDVVSYDPQGDQEFSNRPIVRLEFKVPLDPATIADDQIMVKDRNNAVVSGVQSYVTVNSKGVLHFIFDEDLIQGTAYTVSLKAGFMSVSGLAGNAFTFTFTPRSRVVSYNVPPPVAGFTGVDQLPHFNPDAPAIHHSFGGEAPSATGPFTWAPSTSTFYQWHQPGTPGVGNDLSTSGAYVPAETKGSYDPDVLAIADVPGSFRFNYQWTYSATSSAIITHHFGDANGATPYKHSRRQIMQYYLFGDGSGTRVALRMQGPLTQDAIDLQVYKQKTPVVVDWVGWKLVSWDMANDIENFNSTIVPTFVNDPLLRFCGFNLYPTTVSGAISTNPSSLWMAGLRIVTLGHAVSFDANGGSHVNPVAVLHDETFAAPPPPTKDDYEFDGWFRRSEEEKWIVDTESGVNVRNIPTTTGSTVLTAAPKGTVFTVTDKAQANGYTWGTITFNGQSGWCVLDFCLEITDYTKWDFATDKVTEDMMLYAQWKVKTIKNVTVTFDSQGGSDVSSQEVESGEKITKPTPDPVREGYDFDGWFVDENFTEAWDFATDVIIGDLTLYAKWVNNWVVTFDTGEGTVIEPRIVKDGDKVAEPAPPTYTGYSFGGWLIGEVEYDFDTPVTEDITLVAKWTRNSFNVTFDLNYEGAPAPSVVSVFYGDPVAKPEDPIREGYTFLKWTIGAGTTSLEYNFASLINAERTVYAQWEKIPDPIYTVTFDSQGGSAVDAQEIEKGQKVTRPDNPTKENYTFGGWFKDAACTSAWNFDSETVTQDMTLYAKWMLNTYIIMFNTDEGSTIPDATVVHGAKLQRPPDPSKANCKFAGWYREAALTNIYNFDDIVFSSFTLYAKWNADKVTSFEIDDALSVRIYPNPTDGVFTLEFDVQAAYIVTITDMAGKALLKQTVSDLTTQIDISSFSEGVYMLVINDGKNQVVTRIIKK